MKRTFDSQSGARLRATREKLGMTRDQLAEQIDITPRYLAEVENGSKSMSSLALYHACNALSISADYLLFGREEKVHPDIIVEMLSNLDAEYVKLAEDMLRTFILAVSRSKGER